MAKQQSSTAKTGEKPAKRKKQKRVVSEGVVHIHSTFNNTLVTITDQVGNVVAWSSAGAVGFKGSRKGTPFAAQMAADARGKEGDGLRCPQRSSTCEGSGLRAGIGVALSAERRDSTSR